MLVDISGLDKDVLLQKLWENSKVAGFFAMHNVPAPEWDLEAAKAELREDGYADYIKGRVMKVNIYKSDKVDPWLYDRDNGADEFQEVVNEMRGN
tara:strand:+ start:113 stop:397 length:285 start_codon:yes stop_codon:yes gene_type:complete